MARAGYALGSERGQEGRVFHRLVSALGAFFFGMGVEAPVREEDQRRWWEREESQEASPRASRLTLKQAELWDAEGRALVVEESFSKAAEKPLVAPHGAAGRKAGHTLVLGSGGMVETVVSPVAAKGAGAKSVVTTRRPAAAAVPITAAPQRAAVAAEGAIVRHMVMSESITSSSGLEASRRFSVPRRALLPRYQLFADGDGVVSDRRGGLWIPARGQKATRGRVWFV